jgi:hypothetical protein
VHPRITDVRPRRGITAFGVSRGDPLPAGRQLRPARSPLSGPSIESAWRGPEAWPEPADLPFRRPGPDQVCARWQARNRHRPENHDRNNLNTGDVRG